MLFSMNETRIVNGSRQRDLALVGAGYWGRNLARNFHAIGSMHTICDSSESILDTYGDEYRGIQKTTAFDDVLACPDITRVAIAAPAHLHYRLAKSAILAGKDVYVEKPLCLDIQQAEELVTLAAEKSRILMVGHLLQYHPCVQELQRMVFAGELGKLQYITSNRLNLGKFRQEENSLWSFAPHDISVILSLVGDQLPLEVRCIGESYLTTGVADTTLTVFRFCDGVRAHVYVSWLNPFKEQKLTIVGSQGMVVFDDTRPWAEKLLVHRNYLTWAAGNIPTPNKSIGEYIAVAQDEPLRRECLHFIECCNRRSAPKTDGPEGLRVLSVLKAAHESLEQGGESSQPGGPSAGSARTFFSHPTAVIDQQAQIGRGTKIWHFSHVMAGAEIGERCNIGQNVVVSPGVQLGQNVKVQNNVSIYTGTKVENDVFLGPSCVLTNVNNPRSEISRRNFYESTLIRRGATVGANATIVCGTTLGRYCFVAAGAVVTKDVPDYALVQGNPARQVGWMSRHGHRLVFDSLGEATCPESNLNYRLTKQDGQDMVRCRSLDEDAPLSPQLATAPLEYQSRGQL